MRAGDSNRSLVELDSKPVTSVEFHRPTGTYRTEFDHGTRPPSDAVIDAVAVARECDQLELPPLARSIDIDALESLFAPMVSGASRSIGSVTFEYGDCEVIVNSHGTVEIEPIEQFDSDTELLPMPENIDCKNCGTRVLGTSNGAPRPIDREECPSCGGTEFVRHTDGSGERTNTDD